jgi:hypothetical protein
MSYKTLGVRVHATLELWHSILKNMYSHFTYVNEVLLTKHMSEEQIYKFSQSGLLPKLTICKQYMTKSVEQKSVAIVFLNSFM